MNHKIQTFLILFISILILSITPTTALQTNNDLDYNNLSEQTINDIWNVFDEGDNTELTPEQKNYLEQEDPRIKNKAKTILYNLQKYLNYLYKEYDEYQTKEENNESPTQRTLQGIFTDTAYEKATKNANKIITYLNELNEITNENKTIKTEECKYDELLDECTRNASYKDRVIVQINAPNGHIRYTNLINIDNETIKLKSGKTINEKKDVFNEQYTYDQSNDKKFNIIIVPVNYNRDRLLEEIWDYQDEILSQKESLVENINKISYVFLGTAGLGIIIAGTYKICDTCTSPTINTRHIVKRIVEDETTALMQHEHRDYTRDCEKTITETSSNSRCSKCTISTGIILIGTFILTVSIAIVCICSYLKIAYEKEHTKLREYKP